MILLLFVAPDLPVKPFGFPPPPLFFLMPPTSVATPSQVQAYLSLDHITSSRRRASRRSKIDLTSARNSKSPAMKMARLSLPFLPLIAMLPQTTGPRFSFSLGDRKAFPTLPSVIVECMMKDQIGLRAAGRCAHGWSDLSTPYPYVRGSHAFGGRGHHDDGLFLPVPPGRLRAQQW